VNFESGMKGEFVTVSPAVDLHYVEAGTGDLCLVLVPGWTMSVEVFEHQLAHYADSNTVRCIAFDPRSHGRSSKPEDGHTYWHHGQDIDALIRELDLKNVVLAGWSFGTLAILSYVNQFGSESLSGLMMLDGPPKTVGTDNQADWVTYRHDDSDGQQAFYTLKRLIDPDTMNAQFIDWLLTDPTEESKQWLLSITRQTPNHHASLLNATANFLDFRDDLVALNDLFPLLYVVRAEQDTVVSGWTEINTPTARVEAFGGHMMFWEQPDRFNQILDEYLSQVGKRS